MSEALASHVLLNRSRLDRMEIQVRARVYIVVPFLAGRGAQSIFVTVYSWRHRCRTIRKDEWETGAFPARMRAPEALTIGGEKVTGQADAIAPIYLLN